MDKRAELIKELENFFDVDAAEKGSTLYMFADYIIARDKKNELERLSNCVHGMPQGQGCLQCQRASHNGM